VNKVEFLNLLQVRIIELENEIDEENNEKFTQCFLNFANNGQSQKIRIIFNEYNDYIEEKLKEKDNFTNEELTEVLKKIGLF
jgi:hypothetical protein